MSAFLIVIWVCIVLIVIGSLLSANKNSNFSATGYALIYVSSMILAINLFHGCADTDSYTFQKPKHIYIEKLPFSVYVMTENVSSEIKDISFYLNPDTSRVYIRHSINFYNQDKGSEIYIKPQYEK